MCYFSAGNIYMYLRTCHFSFDLRNCFKFVQASNPSDFIFFFSGDKGDAGSSGFNGRDGNPG